MRKALLLSFMLAMGMILFASPPDAKASTEKDLTNTTDALIAPDTGPLVLEKATMPIVILPDNLIAPAPDTGPLVLEKATAPILDTSPGAQIYINYICTAADLNAAALAKPANPVLRE